MLGMDSGDALPRNYGRARAAYVLGHAARGSADGDGLQGGLRRHHRDRHPSGEPHGLPAPYRECSEPRRSSRASHGGHHGTGARVQAPRPLVPDEELEARVFVAQSSPAGGPPFGGAGDRTADTWKLRVDGASFRVHAQPGLRAVYAVLGVVKGTEFEPYLLGIHRGIIASSNRVAEGRDVVLDMHLDVTVPLTVEGPVSVGGVPALHEVYAWLDLGSEGLVPHPSNWGTGTRLYSSMQVQGLSSRPRSFQGSMARASSSSTCSEAPPRTRRACSTTGSLEPWPRGEARADAARCPPSPHPPQGGRFDGTVAWSAEGSATPEVQQLLLTELGPTGGPRWTVVMPGGRPRCRCPLRRWRCCAPRSRRVQCSVRS